jgi:hypothetical protein
MSGLAATNARLLFLENNHAAHAAVIIFTQKESAMEKRTMDFYFVKALSVRGKEDEKCNGYVRHRDIPAPATPLFGPKKNIECLGSLVLEKAVGFEAVGKKHVIWVQDKGWPGSLCLVRRCIDVSCRKVAEIVACMLMRDVPLDYIDTYQKRIEAVTLEEANSAARDLFPYDSLLIAVLGDGEKIQGQLQGLGLGELQIERFQPE